jgi:hypothetical protein
MESYTGKKKWRSACGCQPTGRPAACRPAACRPAACEPWLAAGPRSSRRPWPWRPVGGRPGGEQPGSGRGPVGWRHVGLPATTQPASSCGSYCALELFFFASTRSLRGPFVRPGPSASRIPFCIRTTSGFHVQEMRSSKLRKLGGPICQNHVKKS